MEPLAFTKEDGAKLSYGVLGSEDATSTLVCHPGGPGLSAAYFGDLSGLKPIKVPRVRERVDHADEAAV